MTTISKQRHLIWHKCHANVRETTSFDEWLSRLASLCVKDLEEYGLPTKIGEYTLLGDDDRWLTLEEVVEEFGFEDESPPSRAAQTLNTIYEIRQALTEGDTDSALRWAVELGGELTHDELYDFWKAGRRHHESGQKAAEATWGSFRERLDRRKRLCMVFELERPKHSTNEATYDSVAKQEGVSRRTVRRAVKGY